MEIATMKKIKYLVWLIPVSIMMACSSMAVDNAIETALPSDFNVTDYALINPDVVSFQVETKIKESNQKLKDKGAYSAADSIADLSAFLTDTSVIKELFDLLGYKTNDEAWDLFISQADSIKDTIKVDIYKDFFTPYNSLNKKPNDDLNIVKEELKNVDYSLVSLHYSMFGELNGRAYRYCTKDDKKTVKQNLNQAKVNAKDIPDFRPNRYCQDKNSKINYLIK
jgi:hypothetical protein